jgi:hypothetical protein
MRELSDVDVTLQYKLRLIQYETFVYKLIYKIYYLICIMVGFNDV